MKLRFIVVPGLLLLALGLILGLLPHEATYADQYGPQTVSCGMAFAGDSQAKIEETSAALAATLVGGARYEPGKILAACSSAQMVWLPITLLVIGGLLVIVSIVMEAVRRNAAQPKSTAW